MHSRFLTLQEIKSHLRVEHDVEDTYLINLGEAVQSICEDRLHRTLADIVDVDGTLPRSIKAWMLLALAELDANRALHVDKRLALSKFADSLLRPHIDMSKGT